MITIEDVNLYVICKCCGKIYKTWKIGGPNICDKCLLNGVSKFNKRGKR